MDIGGVALRMLARPAVLHRMPGRLRLGIPLLKKLPPKPPGTDRSPGEVIAALLSVPAEIEQVDANAVTGTVLIRYRAGRATEEEIVRFVRSVLEIAVRNRERLLGVPPERSGAVAAALEELIRGAIGRRLELDPHLEIPEHVMA